MRYPPEGLDMLAREMPQVMEALGQVFADCVAVGQGMPEGRSREFMLHGVARRLAVMHHALGRVYLLFPPGTEDLLPRDTRLDVQVNLHAFYINVIGVFDNCAWCYVFQHGLEEVFERNRLGVDMFKTAMQNHLPAAIRDYVSSNDISTWHRDFLKNYRDALAHRIPLYVPPSDMTAEESVRYNALEVQKVQLLAERRWSDYERIEDEQRVIGSPSMVMTHSFEEPARPILIHPQMLSDAKTVVEFMRVFQAHWLACR